ncbi:MAG: choice-of-anchor D domain-containing protein [Myxococcota bacterium]
MRSRLLLLAVLAAACGGPGVSRVRPQLSPPASPVDFGTLPVLNERRVAVPVLNLGRARLTVSNVTLGSADGVFQVVSAPATVETGITENIVVAFVPTEEKAYETTLTFETDDTDNPSVTLVLKGVGSTRAAMAFDPPMLDFGRVGECTSTVLNFTITSTGTADLVVNEIAFTEGTSPAYSFVGSTRTPATVPVTGPNGLPGEIQLTVKVTVPAGSTGTQTGGIRLRTTDPDQQEVVIPLTTTVNQAPVPNIGMLGVAAPGQTVQLDGSASMDPDGDTPIEYRWTLRSKPLSSMTTIAMPDQPMASMTLDPTVPGAYEVQLDVTDAQGVKSCTPARATVVAAPAQKLLVELFWDNTGTDLDLHVLRTASSALFGIPDDCHYQNRTPDWGTPGASDDPELVRDALTGYGPEVFGYVNPIDTTYRVTVVFNNELLSATPASKATVRVYLYGVLKAEVSKTLNKKGDVWRVVDVTWPSGEVKAVP